MNSEPPAQQEPRSRGRAEAALRKFHDEEDLERVYDFAMLARLWPYVRADKNYLSASISLLMVMAAFGLARPLVMRAALAGIQEPDGAAQLTRYGFILAGLIVVEQGLAFPQLYAIQIAGARAMARLRRHVFVFLQGRSLTFFDRMPLGRLVTRVTNDIDAIGEAFASGALNAIGDLVRLLAIVIIMLLLDWRMSIFAFAVLPPVMLLANWTRKRMRTAYREVRAKTARMNAFINEQVSGISVVQAYASEARSEALFDELNQGYRRANVWAVVLDATLDASIEMVGSLCIAAILWYAGVRAISPGVDFATLFAFVAYLDMFFMPVRNLSARYTQVQSALAGAERVFQLLDNEEVDAPDEQANEDVEGWPDLRATALRFDGVSFAYKVGTPVLHDVSFSAEPGQTIALVGPTGSGKTTAMSLFLRLYDADEGRVEVLGRNVRELKRAALRRAFAVVPQDVFLFPGTVASNIAVGDQSPDLKRVEQVLAKTGALETFLRRDGGLEAEVLERGSNFSVGERQLLAFARALYRDPPLLILDEPTASMDSETEAQLKRAMESAVVGRTVLIIAHRLSTIRDADRIICLHQGRVVEQGDHNELLANDGMYARLYRLQVARHAVEERAVALARQRCPERAETCP